MTTVLTYPDDIVPDSIDWRIQYTTQVFLSPFGSATQTAEVPGARWSARLNYSNLQTSELRRLSAFFIQCRGMAGRFTLYDLTLAAPQLGEKDPEQVTAGTSPTKAKISISDPADLTVGDYLECSPTPNGLTFVNSGPELKMITEIDGNVITVEPPFRVTPTVGDAVIFNKAKTRFMLDTDDQVGWSSSGSIYLSNFTISCMEIF